jgi:hypothetical protein
MIGSAIAGTGVAALVVAGMAFGMPTRSGEADPQLATSAQARQLLEQRTATMPSSPPQTAAANERANAGELVIPAQAAGTSQLWTADPVVAPAPAEEPMSQASPLTEGEGAWSEEEDEYAEYAAGYEEEDEEGHEEEGEQHEEEGDEDDEHAEGDDD